MRHGTLSTLVLITRIAILEQMADSMESRPPEGEAEFADALSALLLTGVLGIEIGRMLGVESSCITRWTRNGVTPHPIGRKVYAGHLPKIARRQIESLRAELGREAPAMQIAVAA